jgi:hypothetical protein
MTTRPIPFSAPMARAVLADAKTMTRRVAKDADRLPPNLAGYSYNGHAFVSTEGIHLSVYPMRCPYGQPGDQLWVREAWKAHPTFDHLPPRDIPQTHVWYMADDGYKAESRYRQGMHMPRWASRITLEVTQVRVERLNEISEADAQAEGIDYDPGEGGTFHVHGLAGCCSDTAVGSYQKLWDQINGPGAWALNPWVWAVSFKRLKP